MPAIDAIFDELVKRGGSDLHLAVNQPPLARVRGEIVALRDAPISAKELEDMLLELVTPAQRARLAADLDLDLSVPYRDAVRFRASYYVKHSGIAAAFRLVPGRVPSLAELGCPEVVWRLADRRSGLVVIAGPSSNGKTTTMAAMVDHINKTRPCHVLSVESPIEFVHESLRAQITQREVGLHAPTAVTALKSAAREDPDVVVVSELAAAEEIEHAIRLASDGQLVLATFQASGAAATLERLVAAFEPEAQPRVRGLLADSLAGVVVQHLVRGADSKSRVAVHEILVATPPVVALVREGKTEGLADAMKAGAAEGMQTLDAGLERLLGAGKISPEAALDRSIDKEAFARIIARVRPDLVDAAP
ncbi:MAG: PilT/PilU family type 4a pilus ATPase [Labilithrix sp.]|nr:PilT/PilU family type 4a pilus ATPase [Labilithrix sp.]